MKTRGLYVRRVLAAVAIVTAMASAETPARVVAVGDVHGAYPELVSILQRTGIIDNSLNWKGGRTTLVQVGDVLDRGPESRKALDLLMKLEGQAAQRDGKVVALLGNHEAMDMVGDLRYVSPAEYQAFATNQSARVRDQAFQDYQKFISQHGGNASGAPDRDKWMAEHPLGFFELRDAYGPNGEYGRWFRKHDAAAQIGDTIFLHGGLNPDLHYRSIEEINKRIHTELSTYDSLWKALSDGKVIWSYMTLEEAIRQMQDELSAAQSGTRMIAPQAQADMARLLRDLPHWMIISPQGPLWYRGLAQDPEGGLRSKLDDMLKRLKAVHIVMGHTVVSRQAITPRFDDHVFLIDTGMLTSYFHGRPAAIEIQDGSFTAVYADGDQQVLLGPKGSRAVPESGQGIGDGKQ